MTLPTELPWEEEAHYVHTVQYFVALMRQHGVKQVLEDVKNLDLDIYNSLCYHVLQEKQKKTNEIAALFKPPFDDDGRC